jgi:hypothetical protein
MSYKILNIDNMQYQTEEQADLIFCDFVYEDLNFQWVNEYWGFLKEGEHVEVECVRAILNNANHVGIEYDKEPFELAQKRLKEVYEKKNINS